MAKLWRFGYAGIPVDRNTHRHAGARCAATPIAHSMLTPAFKRRILVVDDNLDAAVSLCRFLALLGHDAHLARSGYEAVDLARRLRPEFILLDIGLPGYDGFQVAETLRRDPALASTKIIAVTGHGREEDRERSRQAGIDLHLIKPIDLKFLESLVGNATGKPPPPGERGLAE